ncbi:MAG TPA: Cof-type HAD-IIB family hydrolase [Candidatus Merdenecus merdavium]|nr:Cof-type HAD-IIB family hydrolase [Candidatus Merdenecus merdavium]
MSKKIVFFDIDGTLLHYEHGMNQSTIEGIKELRKQGHLAFINTGRGRSNISDRELKGLIFDGMITGCGTYVEYNNVCLFNHLIEKDLLKRTTDLLGQYQAKVALEGPEKMFYFKRDAMSDDPFILYLEKLMGDRLVCVEHWDDEIAVNKISLKMSPEAYGPVYDQLKEEYEVISHTDDFYELIPIGYNKATGIQLVCDHLNIPLDNTYAFGDSNNDLDMLRYVKYGVAMGNSMKEPMEVSDYITDDILNDGIYNALKYYHLI